MLAGEGPLGLAVPNNETSRGGHDNLSKPKVLVRVKKDGLCCVHRKTTDGSVGDCVMILHRSGTKHFHEVLTFVSILPEDVCFDQ